LNTKLVLKIYFLNTSVFFRILSSLSFCSFTLPRWQLHLGKRSIKQKKEKQTKKEIHNSVCQAMAAQLAPLPEHLKFWGSDLAKNTVGLKNKNYKHKSAVQTLL